MPFAVISRLAMNANGTIINVLIFFVHVRAGIAGADLGILRGGGGLGRNSSRGEGVRVQVRRNFHILTSKKNKLVRYRLSSCMSKFAW